MSTANAPSVFSEHNGNLSLNFPESIPSLRIFEVLQSEFGAVEVSRLVDPLGDWIDIRLIIAGQQFTFCSAYHGDDLRADSAEAALLLKQIAQPLSTS